MGQERSCLLPARYRCNQLLDEGRKSMLASRACNGSCGNDRLHRPLCGAFALLRILLRTRSSCASCDLLYFYLDRCWSPFVLSDEVQQAGIALIKYLKAVKRKATHQHHKAEKHEKMCRNVRSTVHPGWAKRRLSKSSNDQVFALHVPLFRSTQAPLQYQVMGCFQGTRQ